METNEESKEINEPAKNRFPIGCFLITFFALSAAVLLFVALRPRPLGSEPDSEEPASSIEVLKSSPEVENASYQMAKEFVKQKLSYPSTADFSLMSVDRKQVGYDMFEYKGTLTAANAYGVEQEFNYEVKLSYLAGNPLDPTSWVADYCYVY